MKKILKRILIGHILLGIIFIASDAPKYIPKVGEKYQKKMSSQNTGSKISVEKVSGKTDLKNTVSLNI